MRGKVERVGGDGEKINKERLGWIRCAGKEVYLISVRAPLDDINRRLFVSFAAVCTIASLNGVDICIESGRGLIFKRQGG